MPTPTCSYFQATKTPCLKCGQPMGLTLIEPGGRPHHELRTYACIPCQTGESFLMAIKPAESGDPRAKPEPSSLS
jgi:hypothetical protein